ncbi:MAG: NADAR family protein [Gemmatimonadaceae bacterium]
MPQRHDLDSLCSAVRSAERLKYLFFWSHIPAQAAEVGKECLSQWYAATFVIDGLRFPTAEHYMMFRKATLFGDNEAAERILQTQNPGAAKAIGRSVRGFEEFVWEQHRVAIAVDGNCAKFSQSEPLRDFLLKTQTRVLVEASPVDGIWGIGLAVDDPEVANPPKWRGLNLLGFALMDVRERLRKHIPGQM